MNLFQAIIIGIIQGLTEFLPVSSNAHIRIVPALLGWEDPGAAFTAVIQLGTVLAVIIYFAKDLQRVSSAWVASLGGKDKDSVDARMGWAVLYGTIPIIIFGLGLKHQIEGNAFRSLYVIAGAMIGMGILMYAAEHFGKKERGIETVTVKDGVIVGLWQCLALIPGMSRSGSTITGGLFRGMDRITAARFSFLLGLPSITLAALNELYSERKNILGPELTATLVATGVSFIVGYAVISFFLKFLQKHGIAPFVIYRIALGLLLFGLLQTGHLKPDAGIQAKPDPQLSARR